MFTNDIYIFIGNSLLADGYHDIREVSASVIEEKIKEFLKQKLYITDPNVGLDMLLQELEKCFVLGADKEKGMGNICFYLLWYMGMLQGFSIAWEIEEGPIHLKESKFYPGKISELVTPKEIDYINTTMFLLVEASKLNERVSERK